MANVEGHLARAGCPFFVSWARCEEPPRSVCGRSLSTCELTVSAIKPTIGSVAWSIVTVSNVGNS